MVLQRLHLIESLSKLPILSKFLPHSWHEINFIIFPVLSVRIALDSVLHSARCVHGSGALALRQVLSVKEGSTMLEHCTAAPFFSYSTRSQQSSVLDGCMLLCG